MIKIYLLIFVALFTISQSFLEVYIPECAHKIIPNNINYTLANFGYIPYGESFVGQVFLPSDQNNADLCTIEK